MSIPSGGLYVFCEVLRSKLPTNEFEVGLLLRSVPALLKFGVCFHSKSITFH
ncbi:hypothetical protein GLOIN_2v1612991 [Rhizophagus irregularis DAOM 181602=DAOM 197198]|nr:hypothetical protein RhiirB3_118093 [Rhizophagus irregularis]GET57675.1 hypothetical protein GLOIN_2v1612991 [Rhizophagus irregularis DAOM 181602=DAOM 197198]